MVKIKVFKVKYFMFIKYGFCVFKTVPVVFHMLIIRTNAYTGEVKFRAVIRNFFAKKQSHTPSLT